MNDSNEKIRLNKKMYIVVIVFTILLLAYFFYKNRIIGNIFGQKGNL